MYSVCTSYWTGSVYISGTSSQYEILCAARMRDSRGGMALQRTILAVTTVLALWSVSGRGFTIDTLQPIVREPPTDHSGQVFDLFGYSAVLHSRAQPGQAGISNTMWVKGWLSEASYRFSALYMFSKCSSDLRPLYSPSTFFLKCYPFCFYCAVLLLQLPMVQLWMRLWITLVLSLSVLLHKGPAVLFVGMRMEWTDDCMTLTVGAWLVTPRVHKVGDKWH